MPEFPAITEMRPLVLNIIVTVHNCGERLIIGIPRDGLGWSKVMWAAENPLEFTAFSRDRFARGRTAAAAIARLLRYIDDHTQQYAFYAMRQR